MNRIIGCVLAVLLFVPLSASVADDTQQAQRELEFKQRIIIERCLESRPDKTSPVIFIRQELINKGLANSQEEAAKAIFKLWMDGFFIVTKTPEETLIRLPSLRECEKLSIVMAKIQSLDDAMKSLKRLEEILIAEKMEIIAIEVQTTDQGR